MNPFCVRAIILIAATLISSTSFACKGLLFSDGFEDSSGTGHAPILANIADQTFILGTGAFSIDVIATDADPGDVLSYTLSKSPTGMSINIVTGSIHWVPLPSQVGDHDVQVVVCDVVEHSDSISFQITVVEPSGNRSPTLIPPGNRQIQADTAFSTTLFATDPDVGDVLTFALVTAPTGMNISPASGELTWTPSTADLGSHSVTANVTDSEGLQDAKTFDITVIQPLPAVVSNVPPKLTVPINQSIVLGNQLSVQASATDADNDPLVFELVSAPTGMTIDSTSGAISWSPAAAQVGSHDVAVKVSDPHKGVDFGSFIVQVLKVNAAPVAVDDAYTVERGDTLTVAPAGVLSNDSDPDDDALSTNLVSDVSAGTLSLNADGSFEYTPDNPAGTIDMKLKWAVNGPGSIPYGVPAIMDLDGDGIPEIILGDVVSSVYYLNAVHGDTGEFYFTISMDRSILVHGVAVADIDLDGSPEIIMIASENDYSVSQRGLKLMAFEHNGQPKWISEPLPGRYYVNDKVRYGGSMINAQITIADIDQDGVPEILVGTGRDGSVGYTVWDNQGNKIDQVWVADKRRGWNNQYSRVEVIDLDLDGDMEIVVGSAAWSHDGQLLWHRDDADVLDQSSGTFPISANLDDDPYPELVRQLGVSQVSPGRIAAWNHDGTTLWVSEKLGVTRNFGMLSIADVDGDGYADVIAPGSDYDNTVYVLDGRDGTIKWSKQVPTDGGESGPGANGAAVMDMDGDGYNEVLYLDKNRVFHVWDGRDGTEKLSWPTGETGRSLQHTIPVFADVDGDGHADLLTIGDYSLNPDLFRVYESINNDWPPMRAIWNQTNYHVTNINDDGTVPQFERPHWLLPGLNQNRSNQRLPEVRFGSTDSFTYKASDGVLSSNTATVHLNVLPPNSPPQILSTPRLAASPGFEYTYGVVATDADVGETLTYTLGTGPSGMLMDANHIVHWTPGQADLGAHAVVVSVTDSIGVSAFQNFVVTVVAPVSVPDVTGLNQVSAETAISDALLTIGTVKKAFNKDFSAGLVAQQQPPSGSVAEAGSQVNIIISLGAGPADTDNDGDGFTPNEGDCNDNDSSIYPGAPDPEGDGIDQDFDGIDGNLPLTGILVQPTDSTLLTNQAVNLTATGIFDGGTSQNLSGVVTWSDGPQFSSSTPGTFTVTATRDGITGSATVHVVARAVENTPPLAQISAPASNATITEPADIIGTASDDNFLKYELAYAIAGGSEFTSILASTTPVTAGVLGQFDPTMLINGLYTIRLTVFDTGGNQSIAATEVLVDGFLKVGQFSMSFTDASLPATGLPLDLVRTYDSRNRSKGDFGIGWELSFQGISLNCVNPLGDGWTVVKSSFSYHLLDSRSHACVVQIPGQRAEVFDFEPNHRVSPVVPFSFLSGSFKPRPSTRGQLVNMEGNNVAIIEDQPGPIQLFNDDDFSLFSPDHFRYTRPDGMSLVFSAGKVQSITDLAGNSITFGADGFSHSSGRGFSLERDDLNRISKVTDPQGNSQQYVYSAAGDLISHIDAMGNVTRFFYNQHHGLLRIEDPLNRPMLRNDYDDEGRLISTQEPDGRIITFDYSSGGKTQTITDADGSVSIVTADSLGNVTKTQDALGGQELQTFDAEGNLLSRTDENGHTTSYTYDANGNRLTQTNALGKTRSYAYDSHGNVTIDTNELGQTTTYTYNASGLLTSRTNALGVIDQSMSYDNKGNLISQSDALGNTEVFSYNSFGDPTSVTDARGNQATFSYDSNGALLSTTDKQGQTTSFSRNANGEKLTETDPLGHTTQYQYDAAGQLIREINPLGASVENHYDIEGNRIGAVDPLGETTSFEFSQAGNLTHSLSPGGLESVYDYDVLDRQILARTPGGQNISVDYDAAGNIVSQTDVLGNTFQPGYDAGNRPVSMTGPDGSIVQKAYDDAGNLTRQTNARGHSTDFEYDAINRPVKTVFADGSSISQVFDAASNVIQKTDAAGNVTTYDYDGNNNLLSVTEPMGAQTRFEYDANDRRVAIVDARGNRTTMQYDAAGRMTRRVYPDGTMEQLQYDAAGHVSTSIAPDGDATQFQYDLKGRLIRKTYADASFDTFVWSADDQLIEATNSGGTVEYQYNTEGLQSAVLNPDGSSIAYDYNAVGAITSITTRTSLLAPARTTQLAYDGLGRLIRLEDADGAVTDYTFDAMSNLVSASFANGMQSDYQYDVLDRLVKVTHSNVGGSVEQYTYTLDALGNRTQVTTQDGTFIEYAYDARRRVIRESHFNSSAVKQFEASYQYDAVGNRTRTVDLAGQEINYTYNSADQLLTRGSETFTYDANGNLSTRSNSADTTAYMFDVRNRLVKVANPQAVVSYGYDARGERIRRSVNGVDTNYLVGIAPHSQPSQVLAEYDAAGNAVVENVFGLNHLVSRREGGTTSNAHMDASLNVRLLTSPAGSVSDRYNYDAFGNILSHTGASDNPYQFAGERQDTPEDLTYLRARYYDPKFGRFISRDPFEGDAEHPFSLHRYQYADQNPLIYIDPTGEYTLTGVVATVSLIGTVMGIAVNSLVDIKSTVSEFTGRTDKFRAQFCKGGLLADGAALAAQKVLIAEDRDALRPQQSPTSAEYFVAAFGVGVGIGTIGSTFDERKFTAPGNRNVTQFKGVGKVDFLGYSVGRKGYGAGGWGGELHRLPDGSKIPPIHGFSLAGSSSLGTSGATAASLTTLWILQSKNKSLGKISGKLNCFNH